MADLFCYNNWASKLGVGVGQLMEVAHAACVFANILSHLGWLVWYLVIFMLHRLHPTSLHCNTPMSIQSILFACTHKHPHAQRPQIKPFLPLANSRKDSAQEPRKQWIQPWSAYRGLGHTHLPIQTFRSKMHLGYYTCVHVYCRELQTVLTGSTVMAFLSSVQHIQECTYIWHLLCTMCMPAQQTQPPIQCRYWVILITVTHKHTHCVLGRQVQHSESLYEETIQKTKLLCPL